MMDDDFQKRLDQARNHLQDQDKHLQPLITAYGLANLQPHENYYGELISSIISQQISVKAAASIEARLVQLFDGRLPTPTQILLTPFEKLRSAGLSRPKASYIQSLAQNIESGAIDLTRLDALSDQEIVSSLTKVKGIGEWTAQMLLIFSMGRLDVLPAGDLGVQNGIQMIYKLETRPTPQQVQLIATEQNWSPYRSVASWYIWRSLNNNL